MTAARAKHPRLLWEPATASPMMTNSGHRAGTLNESVDRNLLYANNVLLCVP